MVSDKHVIHSVSYVKIAEFYRKKLELVQKNHKFLEDIFSLENKIVN